MFIVAVFNSKKNASNLTLHQSNGKFVVYTYN